MKIRILLWLVTCLLISSYTIAQTPEAYRFPIKPGSTQWRNLTTHKQMVEACLIPKSTLDKMGTSAILESVLSYPLLMDMTTFGNMKAGFEVMSNRFNAFSELMARPDVGSIALQKFRNSKPEHAQTISQLIGRGEYIFTLTYLELLMSRHEVLNRLNAGQLELLLLDIVRKRGAKKEMSTTFGRMDHMTLAYAAVKVMEAMKAPEWQLLKSQNSDLVKFSTRFETSRIQIVDDIFRVTEKVANKGKIAKATPEARNRSSSTPVEITTPVGSIVPDCFYHEEFPAATLAATDSYFTTTYPLATMLAKTSFKYNCHAYAWHMTDDGEEVWMGEQSRPESIYWLDGSYSEFCVPTHPAKVSFIGTNHSAVTTNDPDIFISKWGYAPLMKHHKDYGPFDDYTGLKYYVKPYAIGVTNEKFVCAGGTTFTINNLQAGYNVSWHVNNPGRLTQNGGNLIVKDGEAKLNIYPVPDVSLPAVVTVTVQRPCNLPSQTFTRNIWVGTPALSNLTYDGSYSLPSQACQGQTGIWETTVHPTYPADPFLRYHWSGVNSNVEEGASGIAYAAPMGPIGGSASVSVRASGQCGLSDLNFTWWGDIVYCGGGTTVRTTAVVYPNPARDELFILDQPSPCEIKIFNSDLKELLSQRNNGKNIRLEINHLRGGIYYIQIRTGDVIKTERLTIERK